MILIEELYSTLEAAEYNTKNSKRSDGLVPLESLEARIKAKFQFEYAIGINFFSDYLNYIRDNHAEWITPEIEKSRKIMKSID